MAEIGSLVVRVTADSSGLTSGLQKASQSVSDFSEKARPAISNFAKMGAAATAAGVAIFAALVNKSREAINTQADLAARLGTTADSISTVRRAADLSGASVSAVESASARLSRRLSKAAADWGPAVSSLKSINMEAEDLIGLPLDKQIETINRAIRDTVPAAQQAAVAVGFFGDEGALAMQMIDPDTIGDAARQAKLLGQSLTDIDVERVGAASDSFDAIGIGLDGLIKQLTVELSPVLDIVGKAFLGITEEAGGMETVATKAFNGMITGLAFVADAADGVKRVFTIMADVIVMQVARVVARISNNLAFVLEQLTKLPGVDFSETTASIRQFADTTQGIVGEAWGNIQETLDRPLAGQAFKQMVDDAREASIAAAEAVVSARESVASVVDGDDEMDEKEREKLEAKLERLRESLLSEEEAQVEHYERSLELLQEAMALELLTEEEHKAQLEALEQQHTEKLIAIRKKGLTDLQKFTAMSYADQTKKVTGELANMTAGVSRENRAMFEINKAAGIANAVVSAYQGISTTLGAYPYPLNIAMAAAHAAAAFAQVSAIKSASFDGGGGAAPSVAGSTAATPVSPVQNAAPEGGTNQVLAVEGIDADTLFTGSMVRSLGERLAEWSRNGGEVVFA